MLGMKVKQIYILMMELQNQILLVFGKKNNIAYLDTENKYSWIKSPLYDDEKRMEVGPLARMIVGVARGDERISKYVTTFLKWKFTKQSIILNSWKNSSKGNRN